MHYVFLQNALTFACDSLMVGSTAYFGIGLALHLKEKWDELEVKPKAPAQLPAAVQPMLESTAIPVEAFEVPERVAEPIHEPRAEETLAAEPLQESPRPQPPKPPKPPNPPNRPPSDNS